MRKAHEYHTLQGLYIEWKGTVRVCCVPSTNYMHRHAHFLREVIVSSMQERMTMLSGMTSVLINTTSVIGNVEFSFVPASAMNGHTMSGLLSGLYLIQFSQLLQILYHNMQSDSFRG